MPKFKPGTSGNPKGRPPGSGIPAEVRSALRGELPDVLAAVVAAAKSGDMSAAKILLDRVVPTLKPVDLPLAVACRDSLSEQGRSVLEAASSGQVSPEQADRLLSAISKQARVVEIDELVRRVEALEDGD